MKTTIEVPDLLLRRAKLAAAKRRTTLKRLFISALEIVASEDLERQTYVLPKEASGLLEVNDQGIPILKRKRGAKLVTNAGVDKIREALGI